jgi:hypothetical protein
MHALPPGAIQGYGMTSMIRAQIPWLSRKVFSPQVVAPPMPFIILHRNQQLTDDSSGPLDLAPPLHHSGWQSRRFAR